MSSPSSAIPVLFTLPPSNRHEIILIDTSSTTKPSLKTLNKLVTSTIASSPNCSEFMGKYKSQEHTETIQEIKIHWSEAGRDRKVWPEYTIVTDDNFPAILELMKLGAGKDVLEIKVGREE